MYGYRTPDKDRDKERWIGYVRVSTNIQDLGQQRLALEDWCTHNGVVMNEIIEVTCSSKATERERELDKLEKLIFAGTNLLVSELSRIGRDFFGILTFIKKIIDKKANVVFIKEGMTFSLNSTGVERTLLAMFADMAEDERHRISVRTKQALQALKAKGVILGNPKLDETRHYACVMAGVSHAERADAAASTYIDIINKAKEKGCVKYKQIAKYMNDERLITAKGNSWNTRAVSNLMKRLDISLL